MSFSVLLHALALVLLFSKTNSIVDELKIDEFKGNLRLPKFAVPRNYTIRLQPDLEASRFIGSVEIRVEIISSTRYLVFNFAELNLTLSSVQYTISNSSQVWLPTKIDIVSQDQIVVLVFPSILPKGYGFLAMEFGGVLNDLLTGFYRSKNGANKFMAVTQFEPISARRCFPCWDEPAFKATFKMMLKVPSQLVALSNMPVIDEKVDGDMKTVSYQESPLMSSYLVAVVVGKFEYVEKYTADGIRVRVYCPLGRSYQGKFALDVAVRTLDFYKDYFSMPYALPKLDMIGIPDFDFGGMENYGLITFAEELLYEMKHLPPVEQQTMIAVTVAHELGHQWLGNLVTMDWWSDIWLNEGFATWALSYTAVEKLHPEWDVWTIFIENGLTIAFNMDAEEGSLPIQADINQTMDIRKMFNMLTYNKGAAVVRMLENYIGPETFQRALSAYVRRYAWSNVKTTDLWAVLEEVSGLAISQIFSSWVTTNGFPLVSIRVRDQGLIFEQSEFLSQSLNGLQRWTIPVTLCCGSNQNCHNFLLRRKAEIVNAAKLSGCSCVTAVTLATTVINETKRICPWIRLNTQRIGFYRVKYDAGVAKRLRYPLEQNYFSSIDRFGILDDTDAFSEARQLPLGSLYYLDALREERHYIPLEKLMMISDRVARIAADATPKSLGCIKQILRNILQNPTKQLGWDPKPVETEFGDETLRANILTTLAVLGDNATLNEATRRFHLFLKDRNTSHLAPSVRKAAFVAVMQRVTANNRLDYELLLKVYNESESSEDRSRIISALASCPDRHIVLEGLNFLLSSKMYDVDDVLSNISWEGREVGWTWLKENWSYLLRTRAASDHVLGSAISNIVSSFASSRKMKEAKDFFANLTVPSLQESLTHSLQLVSRNTRWVQSIKAEKQLAPLLEELAHGYC